MLHFLMLCTAVLMRHILYLRAVFESVFKRSRMLEEEIMKCFVYKHNRLS